MQNDETNKDSKLGIYPSSSSNLENAFDLSIISKICKFNKVFSGRYNGLNARLYFNLDTEDVCRRQISIYVPEDTVSVNSSFFIGMFEDSIKYLRKDFYTKYIFKGRDISRVINASYKEIIRTL